MTIATLPQPVAVDVFPWAPGTPVRDASGTPYTVAGRGGRAFLACCAEHEADGTACGWYPDVAAARELVGGEAYQCGHEHGEPSRSLRRALGQPEPEPERSRVFSSSI